MTINGRDLVAIAKSNGDEMLEPDGEPSDIPGLSHLAREEAVKLRRPFSPRLDEKGSFITMSDDEIKSLVEQWFNRGAKK